MNLKQKRIFALTYITYASYYLARLNFSVVLPMMSRELLYSNLTLGLIGGAFSISYAFGQLVHGQLADSVGAKRIILLGLALSAAMNALFGHVDSLALLIIVWGINGFAQSTGWPSAVKIISSWFRSSLGTIAGLFGSCFLVGNMIAWPILGWIAATYGWRAAFLAPTLILAPIAALFYVGVTDQPRTPTPKIRAPRVRFTLKKILLSKMLVTIASAYVMLQFVRSGFTLWATSYLFDSYNLALEEASYAAAAIPFGGIVGSVISGWLSDRMRRFGRTFTMLIFVLFLSPTLLTLYVVASYGLQVGIALLFALGLALYGPHVLMATMVPMEHEESHGGAGVAGFIDGVGYLGSTFADPFIGWIVDFQGWNGAVTFWLISSLGAALLVFASWIGERRGRL